jgi:hypothetical protein
MNKPNLASANQPVPFAVGAAGRFTVCSPEYPTADFWGTLASVVSISLATSGPADPNKKTTARSKPGKLFMAGKQLLRTFAQASISRLADNWVDFMACPYS